MKSWPGTFGRDLIEAAAGEGIAAQEPPGSQQNATQRPVRGNGEGGVLRTSGQVATSSGLDRMNRRGEPAAVEVEQIEQDAGHLVPRRLRRPTEHETVALTSRSTLVSYHAIQKNTRNCGLGERMFGNAVDPQAKLPSVQCTKNQIGEGNSDAPMGLWLVKAAFPRIPFRSILGYYRWPLRGQSSLEQSSFARASVDGILLVSHPFRRKKRNGWGTQLLAVS